MADYIFKNFKIILILSFAFLNYAVIANDTQDKNEKDSIYKEFLQRVYENEDYIGFLSAEDKLISETTEEYLEERRKMFIGVSQSEEEPFEYVEPFIEYCVGSGLLSEADSEEWERVLTILSFELYKNKPIFKFETDKVIEHRSIVFAKYPNKNLELDLFVPKEPIDKPMPAVVCIHGGGWVVNRRIWFEPFAKYLASKGIAAVTIDYRMLPAVTLKECVYDSKAAVRWVRANAAKYNIDPDRIGALGASAGAQLAALLGTTADILELEGDGGNNGVSSKVQAVVGIATPAFNIEKSAEFAESFGFTIEEMKTLSPYENVTKDSAPLFLIHGDADETVPPHNSQDLYDKYKELGVYIKLKWIPNEGHGFYEGTDIAIQMAAEFFIEQFIDK